MQEEYKVWYKDSDSNSCCIKVENASSHKEAREAVLEMLEVSKQAFLGQPVLAVVSGYQQEPVLECA